MNQPFIISGNKFLFFLILMILTACTSKESASDTTAKKNDFTANGKKISSLEFDNKIKQMMETETVPGTSIAIIDKGKVVYSGGYGIKSLNTEEAVDDETVFEAASLSKPYFVYVVYKLVEEGRLDLDKPMYQYVENPLLEYDPRYKLITPRMILAHNSGIENWKDYYDPEKLEIISDPGTKFIYSGEGYNYLEQAVSKILGESYEEYMNRLILEPMNLKRTYLKYKKREPLNYAVGHNALGDVVDKWKNEEGIASSGVHNTAEDYATFIATIFDGKHLTRQSITEILKPLTPLEGYRSWGGGFEVHYHENDTLILHGGHNFGFTSFVLYSVVNQKGYVLMTNSERGLSLLKALNEMTVELPITSFMDNFYIDQYPSDVPKFVKIFKEKGTAALHAAIEKADQEAPNGLREVTMNEIGEIFSNINSEIARKPIEYCLQKYPESNYAYFLLGNVNDHQQDFHAAINNLGKAKELNYFFYPIDKVIDIAKEKLLDAQQKEKIPVQVIADKFTLETELYTNMEGVNTMIIGENDEGMSACYINAGNWLEYNINVPTSGTYQLKLLTTSANWENAQVLFSSNGKTVGEFEIPVTDGWATWKTSNGELTLPKGNQTLRMAISKGYFDVDWIEFTRVTQNEL